MVKTHFKLWLISLFLMMLVVPAILSPDQARARLNEEYAASVAVFGETRVNLITARANSVFEGVVGGLGIDKFIGSGYVKRSDLNQVVGGNLNREASTFTNRYLQTFMLQIYGVFFRGSLLLQWLVYLGFFLIASVIDGVVQRRVKRELMRVNAPVMFAIAFHIVIAVIFTPLAYLLLPAAVSPWFMPIWAVVVAIPITFAISNAVKTG